MSEQDRREGGEAQAAADRNVVLTYRVVASVLGALLVALTGWTYTQAEARRDLDQAANIEAHRDIRAIQEDQAAVQRGQQELLARLVALAEGTDVRVGRLERHVLDEPRNR